MGRDPRPVDGRMANHVGIATSVELSGDENANAIVIASMRSTVVAPLLLASCLVFASVQNQKAIDFDLKDPKGVTGMSLAIKSPLEPIRGFAGGISGNVSYNVADPSKSTGKIVVDSASTQLINPNMTAAMHQSWCLDVKKYPTIEFAVTKVDKVVKQKDGTISAKISGDFSFHGVTKPLTVDATIAYLPGQMIAAITLLLATAGTPGLEVGESVSPFEPYWVSGPYEKTRQCPVCEYGALPLVIVWSQFKDAKALAPVLKTVNDTVALAPGGRQKAFVVDLNASASDAKSRANLAKLANEWALPKVFFLSRLGSTKAVLNDYKLSPFAAWETIVYVAKDRAVTAKFVDPKPGDLATIADAIKATTQ